MEKPAWALGVGFDNVDMSGESSTTKNFRFFVKKGTSKKIIFLTEGNSSFAIWEHQYNVNGSWLNWLTCVEPMGEDCPLCRFSTENEGKFRRYKAMFFTVIDTSEWKDRQGNTHKNEKRLMCCKKKTAELLSRKYMQRIDNDESLKGAMFDVFRSNDDKSISVGEDFDFMKMVDLSSLPDTEEYDYAEILAPDLKKLQTVYKSLSKDAGFDFPSGSEGTSTEVDY